VGAFTVGTGPGCATAVINSMLGRKGKCCCSLDSGDDGDGASSSCCCWECLPTVPLLWTADKLSSEENFL